MAVYTESQNKLLLFLFAKTKQQQQLKPQGLYVAKAGIYSPPISISLMLGFLMKKPCTYSAHVVLSA